MFTIILLQSRLIDITVTLSAIGNNSRRATHYQVNGVSDSGEILVGELTASLDQALETYNKWKGDPTSEV